MRVMQAGVVVVVVACSASLLAQRGGGMRRDGQWDVTMEMQMPNMPNMPQGMTIPPVKTTQCITKEDAADPNKSMAARPQRGGGPPSDCKVTDFKEVGNTISYKFTCTGAQPTSGTAEFVYGTDSYTGTMNMSMERGGQPMATVMKYTGKRLGDCTK